MLLSVGSGTFFEKDGGYDFEFGWDTVVNALVEAATETERTHEALSSFLPPSRYFRFNPRMRCIAIDETNPTVLAEHKAAARDYFKDPDNAERLQELARLINGEELADNH